MFSSKGMLELCPSKWWDPCLLQEIIFNFLALIPHHITFCYVHLALWALKKIQENFLLHPFSSWTGYETIYVVKVGPTTSSFCFGILYKKLTLSIVSYFSDQVENVNIETSNSSCSLSDYRYSIFLKVTMIVCDSIRWIGIVMVLLWVTNWTGWNIIMLTQYSV